MNRKANTLMIAALALFTATPGFAGHDHGHKYGHEYGYENGRSRIHKRLKRQRARIEHGIGIGELTRWEARKLMKQQRRIRRLAHAFREDGYMTRKERRILRHKLDKASDRIWSFKHNDHYRYSQHNGKGNGKTHGKGRGKTYRSEERVGRKPERAETWDEDASKALVLMLNSDPTY